MLHNKEQQGCRMNIAILIGISKYKSEAALPACAFDAENMRRLLLATKKYDDVQLVTEHTNANQVKEVLRQFFGKYQTAGGIDEAFIYFSGHGVYQSDAMFCCADFDSSRPATTSISNGELDDLLRSVKPTVAVKVIDACQSGSSYIKDASAGFEKALGKSAISSFICMASSRQDQSSYASSTESEFTKKWIEAALSKESGSILYRDVHSALADAFVSNPDQTPFFVIQGSGLEVFSDVTDDMKQLAASRAKTVAIDRPEAAVAQLIRDQISERDKGFVAHDVVLKAVNESKNSLAAMPITDQLVRSFYEKSVKADLKLTSIPKAAAAAAFAEEQSWAKRYFVKVNKEPYKTRVPKDPFKTFLVTKLASASDDDFVMMTKWRPSSLESTEPLPLEVAELSYRSTHPSLPAFTTYVGLVHSLTEAMILSATVRLVQRGWDQRAPELSDVQWRYQAYAWSAIVSDSTLLWREAAARGEADIRAYLESLLPKPDAQDGASARSPSEVSSPLK
jgi:hypothetical protein